MSTAYLDHVTSSDLLMGTKILSKREIQIVELIANEYSNKEIAQELFISVGTVETHRRNIFQKLGAKNMAGLIHRAYQLRILKVKNRRNSV